MSYTNYRPSGKLPSHATMEITRKNFTHLMQWCTGFTTTYRCSGYMLHKQQRMYKQTRYDRISRQKWHSLSFPSLSNTLSSPQSLCSHHLQAHSTHSLPDWSRISSSYVVKHIQHSPSSMLYTWCIACIRAAFGSGCVSLLVFEELTPSGLAFVSYQSLPLCCFPRFLFCFASFFLGLSCFLFPLFCLPSFVFSFPFVFLLSLSLLFFPFLLLLLLLFCSFSSASFYLFCSFSARIASASALVNKHAHGRAFLGPEGVKVPGRTKYLDKALTLTTRS